MNIFKKYLAMFLVICMLIGALPRTVWASETDGTEAGQWEETGDTLPAPLADTMQTVDVTLKVGQSQTCSDGTGYFENAPGNVLPDDAIAVMTLKNHDPKPVTVIESGKQYLIVNRRTGDILTDSVITVSSTEVNWGNKTGLDTTGKLSVDSEELWTITETASGYTVVQNDKYLTVAGFYANMSDTATNLTLTYTENGWTILDGETTGNVADVGSGSYRLSDNVGSGYSGGALGTQDDHNEYLYWDFYELVPGTDITFVGIVPGTTTAIVGTTQYNITVTSNETIVDMELEVGETFSYTDITGSYVGTAYTQPDGNYASMTVAGSSVAARTSVTAIESGKRYLIVNQNTGELLTDTAVKAAGNWGDKDALATIPEADATEIEWWTITQSGDKHTVVQNGRYLAVAGFEAHMYDAETLLALTYIEGVGWRICDETTGPALGHGASPNYLSDNVGDNYDGFALGTSDANNGAIYWDIIEIPYTIVSFTGVAPGTTTAKVGYTTYNITVVEQEVDDEVENTATDIWTVDPEIQTQRITDATTQNNSYTTVSWEAYQQALTAARNKLAEATAAAYASPAAAQAAIDELKTLVDALETAKTALAPGKPVTVRYWRAGAVALEETIYVPASATSYELEPTKTLNGVVYSLSTTRLNMAGNVSEFDVHLLKEYEVTDGIIGETNISATTVQARPVKEMTVTVGIAYNLGLADILTTGQTIEWSSGDNAVATVDETGKVTAVGVGTTAVTATIKDADSNTVKTYQTAVTVMPGVAEGTETREVVMYIDQCDNTTVTCVIHANGAATQFGADGNTFNAFQVFEVAEGELLYGTFQKGGTTTDVANFTGLTFFGNPDDRHALAFMSSTNSAGEYMPLHDSTGEKVVADDGNPLGPKYYISGYGSAPGLHDGLNSDGSATGTGYADTIWTGQIIPMAKYFTGLEYDGAMGFNRPGDHGDVYSNLSFVSDPMPEIAKTVDGVLPTGGKFDNYQRYVEDMVAAVNEVVFFKITVTLERPTIWVMENGAIKKDAYGQVGAITYTNAILEDTALEAGGVEGVLDAYYYTKEEDQADGVWDGQFTANRVNTKDITDELNKGWADGEQIRVLEYYLVYKIQEKDIPKFNIENTATLKHNYTSVYSSGALTNTADATAKITVIGVAMDNVVIDFGQTFVYTGLTNRHLKGVYANEQSKATAKYGTVTVTREPVMENGEHKTDGNGYPEYTYTVTYTPHSILREPDTVLLYGIGEENKEKIINGFIVYPATTVYYEEGFAFPAKTSPISNHEDTTLTYRDMTTGSWDLTYAKTASVEQEFERLGRTEVNGNVYTIHSDKKHPYGFDPVYNTDAALNSSYAESHTPGDRTRFSFTGDGIQIFANCTQEPASGYVSVEIREAAAPYKIVRLAMVNTKVLAGSTGATDGQTGNMDGLPVVSLVNIQGMKHGEYIVTITKVMDKNSLYIDGIRIFNTVEVNQDNSPFTIDLEDQPAFYELRDAVLHAVGVNGNTSEDYAGKNLAEQIYNAVSGASALITDEEVDYADSGTIQDLLDKGPKNELFLYAGQTLTFKVATDRTIQVGLKAPREATTASVTVNNGTPVVHQVESSVDMFCDVVKTPTVGATYTVSIQNIGSDILSVTFLKIADDPGAAFAQLTQEDIAAILSVTEDPITILSQPADTEVKMGERFNVEVIASGEGLKYQWYYRNAGSKKFVISGVRDNTYDDVMTVARAGREVYCVITDAAGNSVTTETATIRAMPDTKLEILQQPADQTAKLGERYNAEVIAVGDGLQYRWYFRNQGSKEFSLSGVRDNTYDDVMTTARAGREVYCVITDAYGNRVTTETVKLVAVPNQTLEIVQQPVDAAAKLGEKYLVEVISQGDGLRYQWYYRNAGSKEFVISGVRDNTYDDVMTGARAGREVYCVITDAFGNRVTTETVKLVAVPNQTLEIVQQPVDAVAKLGEKYLVEVIAQGDGLRYQWYYRNAGSKEFYLSGVRDNTYDDVMTGARAGREVYCVITDAFGNRVTTETVKLVAVPSQTLEIVQQPVDAAAKLDEKYLVEVIAQGDGLRYQWYFRNAGQSVFHVSGVKDNTYDDVMTAARAGREVYCVITDAFGNSVTTEIVKLICTGTAAQMAAQN